VTRDKKPIKPETGWNDSENQFSFRRAKRLAEQYGGEPAYVLHADDPYVVIDLDDVGPEEPTKVSEEAGEIVQRLGTYTEASRSGTGLHLICEGTQLPDRSVKGNLSDRGSIEVYDAGQYVVLTGNRSVPTIPSETVIGPETTLMTC
jgi:primase-polymerase (primpol)-like protein